MKIAVAFVATAMAGAMLIQAAPVPISAMQDVLATPAMSAQLSQRDEAQLLARVDIGNLAKTSIEGVPKIQIIDNVVPSDAGSSHLDPPLSSHDDSLIEPTDDPVFIALQREHNEFLGRYRSLRQLFAGARGVRSRQRAPHQKSWEEGDLWKEESAKHRHDLKLAGIKWKETQNTYIDAKIVRSDKDKELKRKRKERSDPSSSNGRSKRQRVSKEDLLVLKEAQGKAVLDEETATKQWDAARAEWHAVLAKKKKHEQDRWTWSDASYEAKRVSHFPESAGTPLRMDYHLPPPVKKDEP